MAANRSQRKQMLLMLFSASVKARLDVGVRRPRPIAMTQVDRLWAGTVDLGFLS